MMLGLAQTQVSFTRNMSTQDQNILNASVEKVVHLDHSNNLPDREDKVILNINVDCEESLAEQAKNQDENDPRTP